MRPPERDAARRDHEELERDYARVFAGADGERVLADILERGRLEQALSAADALRMARDEGGRLLALHVRRMVLRGRRGPAGREKATAARAAR